MHDSNDFKQLFKDRLFLVKVRSYNSIFTFKFMGASFAENARIDEQVTKVREGLYTFRVQGTVCYPVSALLPVEIRTPTFAQSYGFHSDMETQMNIRCSIMDGLDNFRRPLIREVKGVS